MTSGQKFLKAKRRVLSALTAGIVGLAAFVMMPASANAWASVPGGTEQLWVGMSYAIFSWDESTDYVLIYSRGADIAPGQCADAIFDWHRDDGNPFTSDHHDPRLVRTCQRWSEHRVTLNPDTGGSLRGMQKAAFCVGPDNATTTAGTCVRAANAEQGFAGVNVNIPNNCIRAWKKNANGTTVYYPGGSSTSCSS